MIIVYTQKLDDAIYMATCLGGIIFRGQTIRHNDFETYREDIGKALLSCGYCKTTVFNEDAFFVWGENLVIPCSEDDYKQNEQLPNEDDTPCFFPSKLKFKPSPGKEAHANYIKGIFQNKEAKKIYNASIGTNGCRQFVSLYNYSESIKSVLCVEIESLTPEGVQKAFSKPSDYNYSANILISELTRQYIYFIANYNLEKFMDKLALSPSIRVTEIPIANAIVHRQQQIQSQNCESHYSISIQAKTSCGEEFTMNCSKVSYTTENEARKAISTLPSLGYIKDIKSEDIIEYAEGPHNLDSIEKAAQSNYGYMPAQTVITLTELFQLGLITDYNTNSRNFPNVDVKTIYDSLFVFKNNKAYAMYFPSAEELSTSDDIHFSIDQESGILPTGKVPTIVLSNEQKNIYELICKEVLKVLLPARKCKKTVATTEVDNMTFSAISTIVESQGFSILDKRRPTKSILPDNISIGDELHFSYSVQKKTPSPVHYLKETELISTITKKKNLTNNQETRMCIESLLRKGYLIRKDRKILATEAGMRIINLLSEVNNLADGSTIIFWNKTLSDISSSEDVKKATSLSSTLQSSAVQSIKKWYTELIKAYGHKTSLACPSCGKTIFVDNHNFLCHDCKWKVPNMIYGRIITEEEMNYLLKKKATPLIKGFTGMEGCSVVGKLILDSDNQLQFTRDSNFSCPVCKTNLRMNYEQTKYYCPKCNFSFKTRYLQHTLTATEISGLLENFRTAKITNLHSKSEVFDGFFYIDASDNYKVKCKAIR